MTSCGRIEDFIMIRTDLVLDTQIVNQDFHLTFRIEAVSFRYLCLLLESNNRVSRDSIKMCRELLNFSTLFSSIPKDIKFLHSPQPYSEHLLLLGAARMPCADLLQLECELIHRLREKKTQLSKRVNKKRAVHGS